MSLVRRLLTSLSLAAGLLAGAPAAHAADPQINAVPRSLALAPASAASASTEGALIVGSKRFTESYILGEILRQAAAAAGPSEHRPGLGNTAVVLAALKAGAIDVYPEYLGTVDEEILGHRSASTKAQIDKELAAMPA